MMLDDPGLRERATELMAQGQFAAAAFTQAAEEQALELEALDDEYLSARAPICVMSRSRCAGRSAAGAISASCWMPRQLSSPTISAPPI